MPTKRKPATGASKSKAKRAATKSALPDSSVAPAERLARLLKDAKARGIGPMTEAELANWVEENRAAWPDPEEIDLFIDWLHKARREGRYD